MIEDNGAETPNEYFESDSFQTNTAAEFGIVSIASDEL